MKRGAVLIGLGIALFAASPAHAEACPAGRNGQTAMWYSILHPGVGEYYLRGWGPWPDMPQKKFWLGFIPFYGWPGYLQVKSAIDAANCRTNDEI